MEIKISTKHILAILLVVSWIIFIGLCIVAGGFITYAIFSWVHPSAMKHLWQQVDLSALYSYDRGHFFVEIFIIIIVAVAKAWMFYLIVKILHNKKFNLEQPFSKTVQHFILLVSFAAFVIGIFSHSGLNYATWLSQQGVAMPSLMPDPFGGADVWLFMAVVLFVIALIFKRGIEIQTENELTI